MVFQDRFAGARLQEVAFPDDKGDASAELTAALAAYSADPEAFTGVLRALQSARLLVPVVALLGEVEYDEKGLAHDKSSDMAAVLIENPAGERALLAFTSTEALQAWNPEARPVPVPSAGAAQSALQDNAVALLIDTAGPVRAVVSGPDLVGLAAGWTLAELDGESVWLKPADD
ncbi:SseB family protein [Nocardioides cavernaquae]|uniref:SseB family protein n=1 Tax=Nocardioides cavernaquae TaxID=2321396 RepID=A0A3A5HGW6_9ACTN|nr:SseB family protein [Nocardioides cavernaquae]RJS47324.1 SseB family protein [Nocardioides cavernaquae]